MLLYIAPITATLGVCYYKIFHKKLTNWIIQKVVDKVLENYPPPKSSHSIEISENGRSLIMSYTHLGRDYKLFLPYNRRATIPMAQYKASLNKRDGLNIDITQQPGIPYLVTPEDLGGDSITILNRDNGVQYTFGSSQTPLYANEVLD